MEWLWKILVELVIGGLCGFVASKIMKVSGKKWWFYVIVGLIGGLVGGLPPFGQREHRRPRTGDVHRQGPRREESSWSPA